MSPRQSQILNAIVEIHAQTAEPVGSSALSDQFGYSPATIRAEMADLERRGYITHTHTSSGRIPTDRGYRAYVNNLKLPRPSGRLTDVVAKRVASAGDPNLAVKTAAESLADITHNVALATLPQGLFTSGIAGLLTHPEFLVPAQAFEAARLLDHLEEWLFEAEPADRLNVYIGGENPIGKTASCSLIVARFASPYSTHSYIGILGPTRQSYGEVMGWVDYAGKLLETTLRRGV